MRVSSEYEVRSRRVESFTVTEFRPSFRPPTDADIGPMVEVLQAAFPRWPTVEVDVPARDHLRWKLENHPLAWPATSVTELDGEIIGLGVQMCRGILVRGSMLTAHSYADGANHPRFQGRGLSRLGEPYVQTEIEPLFDLFFNTESNHPRIRSRNVKIRDRLRFANELRTLAYSSSLRTFAGVHRNSGGWRHLGAASLERARRAIWRAPRAAPLRADLVVETVDSFDADFDSFWETSAQQFDFIGERSARYLNWRYCDPRGGESVVRVARLAGSLGGYAVLKQSAGELAIADLLVSPEHPPLARTLVADAVDHATAQGLAIVTCLLPRSHAYRQAFLDEGFADMGRDARLIYTPRAGHDELLSFLGDDASARIHVTRGDFDFV